MDEPMTVAEVAASAPAGPGRTRRVIRRAGVLAVMCAVAAAVGVWAAQAGPVTNTANNAETGVLSAEGEGDLDVKIAVADSDGDCEDDPGDGSAVEATPYTSSVAAQPVGLGIALDQDNFETVADYCLSVSNWDTTEPLEFLVDLKNIDGRELSCETSGVVEEGGTCGSGAGSGEAQDHLFWGTEFRRTDFPLPNICGGNLADYTTEVVFASQSSNSVSIPVRSFAADPAAICLQLRIGWSTTIGPAVGAGPVSEAQSDEIIFDMDITVRQP